MAEHEEEAGGGTGAAAEIPGDAPVGPAPGDKEHAEVRVALDHIEAALDEAAATIARMG